MGYGKWKSKKEFLDYLYYDIGKQACNFELAILFPTGAKSRWIPYLEAQTDADFLTKANSRTILTIEIVLDLDPLKNGTPEEIKQRYEQVLQKLDEDGLHYLPYLTGSRGYHVHLIFPELANMDAPQRKKIKEFIINKYGGDSMKKSERTMIALEYAPHWKTGNPKILLRNKEGINSLDTFLREIGEKSKKDAELERINRNAQYDEAKLTQADKLVKYCMDNAYLFHDQYKEPYAAISVDEHKEIHSIKSTVFKRWLAHLFYDQEGKVPNSNSVSSALKVIEAKACMYSPMHELHNRVSWHEECLYYDLTNEQWQAVKITSEGWEIVNQPPIIFKRYNHQKELCLPERADKNNANELFKFFNLKNDHDKQLLLCYIATCFIPNIPHPILILYGPHGSSKTSVHRIIRRIVDPSTAETLTFPKEVKELIQNLSHNWFLIFDNLSVLPDWLSDILCRAVTGDGFSKRGLFTDDDDIIYTYVRVIGLNGINIAASKADLLDRSIILPLERIDKKGRKTEGELWKQLEKDKPKILGALLDALSEAIRIKESMMLEELPRMADFAIWGEAISRALGYAHMSFLEAYQKNIDLQNSEALHAHIIAPVLLDLMSERDVWQGSASELLAELNLRADQLIVDKKDRAWPKRAHSLSRRLNEIKPNLEEVGIKISSGRDNIGRSHIIIYRGKEASVASEDTVVQKTHETTDTTEANFSNPNFSKTVKELIAKIDKENDGKGAEYERVFDSLPEPKDKHLGVLSKLKVSGDVYECRSGYWKVLT